ncbi:hypothetical protein PAXRUDRAFT_17666 [Paxillus rubicundulus Ve08.2h10]|uniref:Uncharacterized protein n=1 Tax=Paxillus rubicundulus Ve08.2h10 TaxID=930991 RepID=A0A0D0DGU8_9AGAM|nr:hypothetical protein PAXRUDRAFT_17666 [Paxillus rubicundulus Ve08.2h10]
MSPERINKWGLGKGLGMEPLEVPGLGLGPLTPLEVLLKGCGDGASGSAQIAVSFNDVEASGWTSSSALMNS